MNATFKSKRKPKTQLRTVTKVPPINAVLAYQNTGLIHRLKNKEGLNADEAQQVVIDMLKFLYLCGTCDEILAPPEKIDTAWHHFILFTKDYHTFCHQFFGRFIHHSPLLPGEKLEGNPLAKARRKAQEVFGSDLSENWVVIKANGDCDMDCSPSTNCQDPQCR